MEFYLLSGPAKISVATNIPWIVRLFSFAQLYL